MWKCYQCGHSYKEGESLCYNCDVSLSRLDRHRTWRRLRRLWRELMQLGPGSRRKRGGSQALRVVLLILALVILNGGIAFLVSYVSVPTRLR